MPELPDLQVFSRNLTKLFKGKKLEKINVLIAQKLNVPEKELQTTLEGQILDKVVRTGKELHFIFGSGQTLAIHLMLHGQLHVFDKKNDQKFTILELLFDDGKGLVLTDFQKAATPTLNPEEKNVIDALDVDLKYLKEKLTGKRSPVKTILMDQAVMRGIGNAYADEILYDARISPFSIAGKLPDENLKQLAHSIKHVLEDAEKQILKTHPDIISGEFRDFFKVHLPKKKETRTGKTIQQKPIASRKTYYTDEQEMFE